MAASETPTEEAEVNILEYSKAVLSVARSLGSKAGRRALGSTTAVAIREWLDHDEDGKNMKDFLCTMVPKAQDTIAKHSKNTDNEDVLRIERRAVAELKAEISMAVAESQSTA